MALRWIIAVLTVVIIAVVARYLIQPDPKLLTASELLSEAEAALQESGYDVLARVDEPRLISDKNADGLLLFSGVGLERAFVAQNPELLLDVPVVLMAITTANGEAKLIPSALPMTIWSIDGAQQTTNAHLPELDNRIPASQLGDPQPLEVVPSAPLRVSSKAPYEQTVARIETIAKNVLGEDKVWSIDVGRRIATSDNELAQVTLLVMLDDALPGSSLNTSTEDWRLLNCCHRILVMQGAEADVTVLVKPLNSLDDLMATAAQGPVCSKPASGDIAVDGAVVAAMEMTCPFDAAVWFSLQRISGQ